MTLDEAKAVLAVFRPKGPEAAEGRVLKALELAKTDPTLSAWLQQEQDFDASVARAVRNLPIPNGLKPSILAGAKVLEQLVWWQLVNWRRVAVCALLFLTGAGFFLWSHNRTQGLLASSREAIEMAEARATGLAVRESDLKHVRDFLAKCGAPADFEVPAHLRKLEVMGCTLVALQNQTAAVIRFRIAGTSQLSLFVMDQVQNSQLPGLANPKLEKQGEWGLALWTDGKRTYVLAGKVPPESLFRIVT